MIRSGSEERSKNDGDRDVPTIMVVEDNTELVQLFVEAFGERYRVVGVEGGSIQEVVSGPPQLLVVDAWKRPGGKSDWDLVRDARERGYLHEVSVLVCSSDHRLLDGHDGNLRDLDGVAFIAKPFELDELDRMVVGLLRAAERRNDAISAERRHRDSMPARPNLDAGHLLAMADDHRRGLHARRAAPGCSRCLLASIGQQMDRTGEVTDGAG